jgi:hypothetical protein
LKASAAAATLLRYALATTQGGVTQIKQPPANPARFTLVAHHGPVDVTERYFLWLTAEPDAPVASESRIYKRCFREGLQQLANEARMSVKPFCQQ